MNPKGGSASLHFKSSCPRDQVPGALREHDVHVLCVPLKESGEDVAKLHDSLSTGERERASRFRFEKHRSRFIAARGSLRQLIGTYTGVAPACVEFVYGSNGKPALRGGELQFNVSHSEDHALYAFTRNGPVGIDIELVRGSSDFDAIAARFFSGAECVQYEAVPQAERTEAFFRCWTRKEAFIKAIGEGLSYPLRDFDVSLGRPARLLSIRGNCEEASEWSLHHLYPAQGYIGALALKGSAARVSCFSWNGSAFDSSILE